MARIVLDLEIEGTAQRAYDVVNELLDDGEFQDRIGEFSADSGDELKVVSAAVRLYDGLVFHAHSQGDPSVGIGSSGATVEVRGLDADAVTINALRELLEDAFKTLFDDRRARVLTQEQFDALNASGEEA